MGLDVELIRIEGPGAVAPRAHYVPLAVVTDTRFRFAEAVGRVQRRETSPVLNRLDLAGSVDLSSDEMPAFLDELDRVLAGSADEPEREVLRAVYRLGERCRDDADLTVRFVGD